MYDEDKTGLVHISYDGIRFYEIWREADTATYPVDGPFKDNDMKAYCYPDGTIYIMTRGSNRHPGSSQLIKGVLPATI